ncbi:MAG TPA: Rieske 2Fe-2S domain-containing protein, partial [Nitrososphaerales archaeon]|nr:Rieske 2Fe-2S domain-containing protein [Nitrososphaerales archaeon]
ILTGLIAVAAALSTVKLPTSNVLQSETTTTQLGAPTGSIAKMSNLKVNTPVYFEYPTGYTNMLMLLADGSISAVSLYCTHVCCQLTWVPTQTVLYCQCHGSAFDPVGKVLQGPAVVDLPKIQLRIDNNGYIFPTGVSNPGPCQV